MTDYTPNILLEAALRALAPFAEGVDTLSGLKDSDTLELICIGRPAALVIRVGDVRRANEVMRMAKRIGTSP